MVSRKKCKSELFKPLFEINHIQHESEHFVIIKQLGFLLALRILWTYHQVSEEHCDLSEAAINLLYHIHVFYQHRRQLCEVSLKSDFTIPIYGGQFCISL